MSLSDEEIGLLVARYGRERDRYEKMVAVVQRHLQAVLGDHSVRCVVTARAKGFDSLRKKLRKDRDDHDFDDLREEFNPGLLDMSGARVMLYEFDRDHGLTGTRCYQARHRVVSLQPHHMADPGLENLEGVLCEIQVVSLPKHIWNELEHDIKYKEPERLGPPTTEQLAWLDVLWDNLHAAQTAVQHLSRVTDAQRAEKQAEEEIITATEELRLALGRLLNSPVNGDLRSLFRLLNGTETPLNIKALRSMGLVEEQTLASGRALAAAGGVAGDLDEVGAVVAFLCANERGDDFRDLASGWRGPKNKTRGLIESLVVSGGTP